MPATFLLIRHAAHGDLQRRLVGRMAGIHLDAAGQAQADRLALALAGRGIARLQSSPRERALETAAAIAARTELAIEAVAAADEIDAGNWTGQSFDALANDPAWRRWNSARSHARPPGGESMRELQERVMGHLTTTARERTRGSIAIVTHAEPIRAAVLHCLGKSCDAFAEIDIAPASTTTIAVSGVGAQVVALNELPPS